MLKGRLIPILDITTVAASGKVIITPPLGYCYEGIFLLHGFAAGTNTVAGACTNLSEIRVKRDNKVFQKFSGTQLRDRLLLNGTGYDGTGVPNTAPGVGLMIPFAEMFRDSDADKIRMALYTQRWNSFSIEVDLGAASTPTLIAYALVSDMRLPSNEPELLPIVEQLPINASGTKFNFAYPEKRGYLAAISLYAAVAASDGTTATVASNVRFEANGETRWEATPAARLTMLQANRMTPSASNRTALIHDIVFDDNGFLAKALPLPGSTGVSITHESGVAVTGTLTAIVQRYGTPDDI